MYLINQDKNIAYNSADITNIFFVGNELYITVKRGDGDIEQERVAVFEDNAVMNEMFLVVVKKVADFSIQTYEIPKSYLQADQMADYHHNITEDIVKNIWES